MPGEHNLSGGGISVGNVGLDGRAVMAPLSGVTDVAFRRIARRFGAAAVVSEMVASDDYVRGAVEARVRAEGEGVAPHIVQLAGCDPYWIGEAARVAEANGAAVIDINMGCPAKKVTGGYAGSALTRIASTRPSLPASAKRSASRRSRSMAAPASNSTRATPIRRASPRSWRGRESR